MKLRGMQDIGGCRVIVSNEKKLRRIVRDLKTLPEIKMHLGKYKSKDYINTPQPSGYRSYHLIGKFADNSGNEKLIEIQLRTRIQHYWATAVEIVDIFTGQALKSNEGQEDWRQFFQLVSIQFSLIERIPIFEQLDYQQKFSAYNRYVSESRELMDDCFETQSVFRRLSVEDKLTAFANSLRIIDDQLDDSSEAGYVLLEIDTNKSTVTSTIFGRDDGEGANREYTEKEKEKESATVQGIVVALVSSNDVSEIREAYPNYFADSTEFVNLLYIINEAKDPEKRNLFEKIFIQ